MNKKIYKHLFFKEIRDFHVLDYLVGMLYNRDEKVFRICDILDKEPHITKNILLRFVMYFHPDTSIMSDIVREKSSESMIRKIIKLEYNTDHIDRAKRYVQTDAKLEDAETLDELIDIIMTNGRRNKYLLNYFSNSFPDKLFWRYGVKIKLLAYVAVAVSLFRNGNPLLAYDDLENDSEEKFDYMDGFWIVNDAINNIEAANTEDDNDEDIDLPDSSGENIEPSKMLIYEIYSYTPPIHSIQLKLNPPVNIIKQDFIDNVPVLNNITFVPTRIPSIQPFTKKKSKSKGKSFDRILLKNYFIQYVSTELKNVFGIGQFKKVIFEDENYVELKLYKKVVLPDTIENYRPSPDDNLYSMFTERNFARMICDEQLFLNFMRILLYKYIDIYTVPDCYGILVVGDILYNVYGLFKYTKSPNKAYTFKTRTRKAKNILCKLISDNFKKIRVLITEIVDKIAVSNLNPNDKMYYIHKLLELMNRENWKIIQYDNEYAKERKFISTERYKDYLYKQALKDGDV